MRKTSFEQPSTRSRLLYTEPAIALRDFRSSFVSVFRVCEGKRTRTRTRLSGIFHKSVHALRRDREKTDEPALGEFGRFARAQPQNVATEMSDLHGTSSQVPLAPREFVSIHI